MGSCKADDLGKNEKELLRCYLKTTQNIAGCQAIRKRIGHCLFGMRVFYGECIFVTISPNRTHSAMLLKLSRARKNDTGLIATDDCTKARRQCCGKNEPPIFVNSNIDDKDGVEKATAELRLPCLDDRRGIIARDPISSVHHYLICAYVLLPAAFGIRMCLRCPRCNIDEGDPDYDTGHPCQDLMGHNTKPMGGYAGLASAMALANEFQGNGTPHGHGFIALANIYQNGSLQDIADHIAKQASDLDRDAAEAALRRITDFNEHLQREDHFNQELHEAEEPELEKQFHENNDGPAKNIFLSARTRGFYEMPSGMTLWDAQDADASKALLGTVQAEAEAFKKHYEADVQFIFSHVQHHWHPKDAKGVRQPTKYCQPKGRKTKQRICKSGFPMHVCCNRQGQLDHRKYRVRVVCKGVAAEMKMKWSGRRNMMGMMLGRRRSTYFSCTSALLSHVFRSNTNVQTNYRVPITEFTHDADCKRKSCVAPANSRKVLRIAQNAMKAMTGYFGGYISKHQKVGRFELKKSIGALPLTQAKLENKPKQSASSQLAHVVNRTFSVLESKGILRTAPEEFMLASRYHPGDELAAEFIRTFRHNFFHGQACS